MSENTYSLPPTGRGEVGVEDSKSSRSFPTTLKLYFPVEGEVRGPV